MDDAKRAYRDAEKAGKEAQRNWDGQDVADVVGNAGDEVRKDLGNAGDQARRTVGHVDDDLHRGSIDDPDVVTPPLDRPM